MPRYPSGSVPAGIPSVFSNCCLLPNVLVLLSILFYSTPSEKHLKIHCKGVAAPSTRHPSVKQPGDVLSRLLSLMQVFRLGLCIPIARDGMVPGDAQAED